MSTSGAATMAEMEPAVAAVSEGTKKYKNTKRRKQVVENVKENATVESETAVVAAAVPEGTNCKKKRRKEKVAVNTTQKGTVEQEAAAVAPAVPEGTVKCKETTGRKQVVANAKENETVEQEAASITAAVLEGEVNCKKKRRKQKVANANANGTMEQEVSSVATAVPALEGMPKLKENGTVEQEAASITAAVLEGEVKCKKKRRKKRKVANAKENGTMEQEVSSVTTAVPTLEGMQKLKEVKGKERVMMEQGATATSISALVETPKCTDERGMVEHGSITSAVSAMEGATKCKEERVKERRIAEQEATTTTISSLAGTPKCNKEKAKELGIAEQEAATTTVLEGTKKRKRKTLEKKNKMQEQQESVRALSGPVAVDKLVAKKPENGSRNGEGTSRDADVSMDPINMEDPNCSRAKDADYKVKYKAQEEFKNCSEKFNSLQEVSEDKNRQRKRMKKKIRQDASSRSPDISSQDGGSPAKCCLDSSTDHDLAPSLIEAHKEKVKDIYSPRGSLIRFQRKKLLILDLNGLLADINMDKQNAHRAHAKVGRKFVFIRPYCDDFLKFCFQNFELGIWSSRRKDNVRSIVDILMPDLKQRLLFCWDMSKCTSTGCKVIGEKKKPLVLKQLDKLWHMHSPSVPWQPGEFSPSNTLLVDDSPYKALCNPPYTAIFPQPYSYLNQRDDDSLGPGGDLRVYLERLAAADDVQVFVRDNPFGQPSITESDPNWIFYAKIVNKNRRTKINMF